MEYKQMVWSTTHQFLFIRDHLGATPCPLLTVEDFGDSLVHKHNTWHKQHTITRNNYQESHVLSYVINDSMNTNFHLLPLT